ncbi:hydrolase 1, exosortase A system-associated [Ideonella sp. DXS22W]|uniref:Hydrolase 1, exosortase A system-associated n=1 Tax=Pseudaquabacterium inlustre TaxID=2984192 RepID=A0ABU9CNE3_9BURK
MSFATRSRPFWLPVTDSPSGLRAALLHEPAQEGAICRGLVLHVPPFAEELNKCRRMTTEAARALAAAGYVVLQVDLMGCGDSPGDWSEASWAQWRQDVVHAAHWLRTACPTNAPMWLWGLRVGALLAAEALAGMGGDAVHLMLWQPVVQGRGALQQFLRLKSLASATQGTERSSATHLRQQLEAGQTLDIAGYPLHQAIGQGLEAARLAAVPAMLPQNQRRLVWLECQPPPAAEQASGATSAPRPASLASQQAACDWAAAGWHVTVQVVDGPAFWQTVEMEAAPALIEATVAQLHQPFRAGDPAAASPPPVPAITLPTPTWHERWLPFSLGADRLLGVLHTPRGSDATGLAVVVIVGGPQTRLGSHRQFIHLARHLAEAGHAVLRFDVRGMGDSSGDPRPFDRLSDDVQAALDALWTHQPGLQSAVLWGLCDGASAAAIHAAQHKDPRVGGLCLVNPWVRSTQSLAQTQIKHYYFQRLASGAFWHKLLRGGVGLGALGGLLANLRQAWGRGSSAPPGASSFQERMLRGLQRYSGPVQVLLSEHDYTAQEFANYTRARASWNEALSRPTVTQQTVVAADHTFSWPGSAQRVAQLTAAWLHGIWPQQRLSPYVNRDAAYPESID